MTDLQRSKVDTVGWHPYIIAACLGNIVPAAEFLLPQTLAALVGIVAAVVLGALFPRARAAGLALAVHSVPSIVLLAVHDPRSPTNVLVSVGIIVTFFPVVWGAVVLAQKARRGLREAERLPDAIVAGKSKRLVIVLAVAALVVFGGSTAGRVMNDDVNEAVVQKLELINTSVKQIDAAMSATQVVDALNANGLRVRSLVGSGYSFAFSLPVERALARRCINVVVDRGSVVTKVFDRPCHPNDPVLR